MKKKWKVTSKDHVFSCNWFDIYKESCDLPTGEKVPEYYITESQDIVTIIAFDEDLNVVLLHEYKHGIKDFVYTFPSGMMEEGEDPMESARRELLEETGYNGELELIHTSVPNPTSGTFCKHTFIARNIVKMDVQKLDFTENIEVTKQKCDDILDLIRKGEIVSDLSICSFYLALDRMKKIDYKDI